jgi:ATP-dependent Clp protease ATP-binding subunit ClpC
MNGYNFTERVRKVLAMAREEAARLHHEYVGTEHILLGLIREGEGVAASVLHNLSVDLDEIQQKMEDRRRAPIFPTHRARRKSWSSL